MRLPATSLLLATTLLLGACTSEPSPTSTTEGSGTTSPSAPSTSAGADSPSSPASGASAVPPGPTVDLDGASAGWRVVGTGFEGPVQVLPVDGAGTVVVEQVGRLRTLDGATVLDLTDRVTAGGEKGLLGAAVHPDGDRLFVHYSGSGGHTVVSSFRLQDGAVDAGDETVLFEHDQPAGNHNGGALLFDPDGMLVLALGDGGGAGDQFGNGQDPSTQLGALLRFDADGATLAPADGNPFLAGGGDPAVWAYGLRNPWRIAFDDTHLYIADVGQDAVEEVDVIARDEVAGANFGWPILEGTACYREDDCDPAGTVRPVDELRHADGACSIIGGVVVPADHPSGLGGAFLYSDLCDTRLRALRADGDQVVTAVVDGAQLPASPLGFGTGTDGEVWVGLQDGRILELTAG